MGAPYTWNEKHAEAAGLPVPAGPQDAGKAVIVNEAGDGFTLAGNEEPEAPKAQTAKTRASRK